MKKPILAVLISIRPQFVILAAICVFLGLAYAVYLDVEIDWVKAVLAFIGGMCAHASVNQLNDWHDTRSGLDAITERTPFSGGSGALQKYPDQSVTVLLAGIAGLVVTILCGVYYLFCGLWGVIPLGLAGLALIVVYTPWLTHKPLLCLAAPGLAFGPLMVCGTFYVLAGYVNVGIVGLSMIPFFLVNNLLLLNQFPDLEADREVGRITMPIYAGERRCGQIMAVFYAATYLVIILLIFTRIISIWCLFGLFSAFLAIFVIRTVLFGTFCGKNGENALKSNVLVTLLTPLMVGIVLLLS